MAHTNLSTQRTPNTSRSSCRTAFASLLTVAAVIASPVALAQPSQAERFEAAMQAYEVQHFDAAYAALSRLADEGHGPAARVAWLMARHGSALYGQTRAIDAARSARWLEAAAGHSVTARPTPTLAGRSPQ